MRELAALRALRFRIQDLLDKTDWNPGLEFLEEELGEVNTCLVEALQGYTYDMAFGVIGS